MFIRYRLKSTFTLILARVNVLFTVLFVRTFLWQIFWKRLQILETLMQHVRS